MANAKLDQNSRPTVIAASSADGMTVKQAVADMSSHRLLASNASTGTDNGNNLGNAMLDENSIPVWTAKASDGSGSIIEIYADPSTGAILIDSN